MSAQTENIVVKGVRLTVEFGVIDDEGSMPSKVFFESLTTYDQAKFLTIFERLSEHGVHGVSNEGIFKKEREFWAAKRNDCKKGPKGRKMVRLVGYVDKDRFVLTHGFWKPQQSKWPEKEFTEAENIRNKIEKRERTNRAKSND